ncbi:MAG: hypothetical protein RDV48_04260 [Candidatus Eremiobacteraeota bacterium]|nr:hypothetical protein [Candidatus Eremiobacteraeota bacterium]
MALYILDKNYGENAVPYLMMDEEAKVLLIHDGLYLDAAKIQGKEVYVFESEVEERGLGAHLPETYKKISYAEAIDLFTTNSLFNFA